MKRIAEIVQAAGAQVRVVISPLYNQIKFSPRDLSILNNLFGEGVVYDFSGINPLTKSYTGYYEQSHYRPKLAKAVLDSLYGGLTQR